MAQSSPSRSRTISASALSFVFTLCLPYTSATPLPSSGPISTGIDVLDRSNIVKIGFGAASAMRRISRRLLAEAGIGTTATSSTGVPGPPRIIEFARMNSDGYYRVPDQYVILVQEFNPGFIVLSYAIAFVGSLCTLELLIRRTTNSGWRNQLLLASAGFTFGAVSTFAMHFIFNNSLSLHHPLKHGKNYPSLRLAYDPGFTILSLVASCLAMTLAFFVMGTTLSDWWCIPGVRRKRRRRASSVSVSEVQKQKDEYGTWKETHKNVIRRGTMGVGALLQRAGSVAKWSMMDMNNAEGERANKSSKRNGKWLNPLSPEEDIIRNDKKLEELDFRLGRSAVKLELAKRVEPKSSVTPVTPVDYGYSRRSVSSIRPMASDASLPQEPLKAFYPPQRRSSVPTLEHANDSELFSPSFNFPMKAEDPISSTTQLIPLSAPSSARIVERSPDGWPGNEMSPDSIYDPTKRRASLPAVSYTVARTETPFRPAHSLSRIQSLPEVDPELGPSGSRSASYDKQMSQESALSNNNVESIVLDRPSSSHNRHVEFKKKPAFTTIERFLGFDVVTREEIIKIFITGTVAGMGVCSMHYIGQLSIIDMPYIAYKAPYVVGSVVIASGAVVIALYIMFIMLRPKLKHTWLSKIAVALILSIAVVAMHFTGMRGTIYAWPTGGGIKPSELLTGTNRAITGIVAALAFLACTACAVFFVLHSIKLRRERARRRRVVVAAVFMDQYDRVLVNSTDGMLPMCDIAQLTGGGSASSSKRSLKSNTNSFNSDSTVLGMDLTTGHEAFVSALKMSWAWRNPALATHNTYAQTPEEATITAKPTLASTMADIRRGSVGTTESTVTSGRNLRLSVTKFLERFAMSSSQLAVQLLGSQDGISRLGVLYDQILTTGWVKLNHSNDTVSKGQLIFLVRRVLSADERNDLLAKHFIFAEAQAVASALHKTLSVPFDHTVPLLEDIRVFCDSTTKPMLQSGTLYTGVAVVQATPFDGLRILVEQDHRAQLPLRELCPIGANNTAELSGTLEELGEAIGWLEGMSLVSIITRNMAVDQKKPGGERVSKLLIALERAVVPMLDDMLDAEDMQHILPRLSLHPVLVPLTPGGSRKTAKMTGYTPPYAVVFYANYDAAVNTFTDKWLPFSLFRAQNACVMAPRIAAASKMDQLYSSQIGTTTTDSMPEEYEYSRRPSKVQFDFPDNGPSPSTTSPVAGGMFTGFSFPPKNDIPVTPTPATGSAPSGLSAGTWARRNPTGPAGGAGGIRRSSMVTRSRYDSIDVGSSERGEGLPGVAEWDPDWLSMLLRTKLRAQA